MQILELFYASHIVQAPDQNIYEDIASNCIIVRHFVHLSTGLLLESRMWWRVSDQSCRRQHGLHSPGCAREPVSPCEEYVQLYSHDADNHCRMVDWWKFNCNGVKKKDVSSNSCGNTCL